MTDMGPTGPAVAEEPGSESFASERRLTDLIRWVFSFGVASVAAGVLVGGVGGRLAMRISAIAAGPALRGVPTDAGNRVGEITIEGTVGLILFGGIFSGLFGAVLVVMVASWLPARFRRSIAGALMLALVGGVVIDATSRDFMILDPPLLNIGMFASLVFGFGALAVHIGGWIFERLSARQGGSGYGLAGWLLLGIPAVFGVLMGLFSKDFCGCRDPAVELGVALLIVGAATVVLWAYQVRRDAAPTWFRWTGRTLMLAAAAVGAMRLVEQIRILV